MDKLFKCILKKFLILFIFSILFSCSSVDHPAPMLAQASTLVPKIKEGKATTLKGCGFFMRNIYNELLSLHLENKSVLPENRDIP